MAPKLSYGPPSIESAQVLLAISSILRGTAMPDLAPMLVAVAIRMLQTLDAHKVEAPSGPYYFMRGKNENEPFGLLISSTKISLCLHGSHRFSQSSTSADRLHWIAMTITLALSVFRCVFRRQPIQSGSEIGIDTSSSVGTHALRKREHDTACITSCPE